MALHNSFRSLKNLSIAAIVGLSLMGIADLLSGVMGLGQIVKPDASVDLDEDGVMSIWLMLQGLIYLFKFPVYVFAVVSFLMWLHRAHTNLGALQTRNLEFTPGWAVGWWFIPFANLVKPYQAVREVWWESNPDTVGDTESTFLTASLRTAPMYMGVWWAAWLLSNFAANITARVYDPEKMENLAIGGGLFALSGILSVAAAILAIMVVRDITERQTQRHANVLARAEINSGPPPPPIFDRDL